MAFAHAVENAVSGIRQAPTGYPLAEHGTRKFVFQQFPFNIFYRAGALEIVIGRRTPEAPARVLVQ